MKAQITLKSGAAITVDVTRISVKRSPVDDSLVGIEWDTPDDRTAGLLYIDIEQIAAIVILREPKGGT